METAIEYQSNKYNTSAADSRTLDHEETILGHLLAEKNHTLQDSLTYLASYAKTETKTWEHTESVSSGGFWIGLVAGGVSFMAVGAGPIGLAVGGLIAAIGSGGSWYLKDISERVGALRRTEFELHKHHPWIRDRLWELSQNGASTAQLVAIYDRMIFKMFSEGIPSDGSTIAGSMSINPNAQDDKPEIQLQQGFQNNDNQIAPKGESITLVETELQPIAVEPIALAVDTPIAVAPNIQHIVSPVWDPAQDLGENPQSALIVGTPGSGKGVTVSNAVRVLKSQNPTLTVMMIDPKGDENEAGYWQPVTDIFESFALMDCLDPDEGAAWLLSCMSKFQKLPAPKLLIFDELLAASIELEMADKSMKALPKLKKFMAGIVAQGDSKGVWVWAMSQSPQCSDLGLNGGVRGNLRIIAIVSPKNKTAIQVITSTKLVPMVDGGMDELDKIMASSPVGRAVFDGKIARWLPMPKLENHSGFDRDNRSLSSTTPIESPSPSSETQKLSQGQVNWERLKVGSPAFPEATDAIDVETMAVVETNSRSAYDDWNEYPVHQAILVYLQGKTDKSDRNVYDSIKKKIDSEQWESIPGTDNMAKLKNVLSYLTNTKKVLKVSPNSYSAVN